MSDEIDNKETETDRRSLITAVAVAGAAVPLMATSAVAQDDVDRCGNEPHLPIRFVVDLGGVQLPRDRAAALGADIRKIVLANIARAGIKAPIYQGPLPPYWFGIIVRPPVVNIPDRIQR